MAPPRATFVFGRDTADCFSRSCPVEFAIAPIEGGTALWVSLFGIAWAKAAAAASALLMAGGPAGAFTFAGMAPTASADRPKAAIYRQGVDAPKLERVWRRWGCRHGWGWRGPALLGGLAAGAIIGGAMAAPYYGYGPYYGGPYYGGPYYPGCWRSVWTAYGWRRAWIC